MAALQARLAECHLEMHPTKTKIVYCKDGSRKGSYVNPHASPHFSPECVA
jgi:hypothetical protein